MILPAAAGWIARRARQRVVVVVEHPVQERSTVLRFIVWSQVILIGAVMVLGMALKQANVPGVPFIAYGDQCVLGDQAQTVSWWPKLPKQLPDWMRPDSGIGKYSPFPSTLPDSANLVFKVERYLFKSLFRGAPVLPGLPISAPGTYAGVQLDAEQLSNARTIASRGTSVGAPGISVALVAAYTESRLRNVGHGDGSSLGLFQMVASWGTAAQRMDPAWSSRWFFDQLQQVPGWQQMPPGTAAQAVERSGFPGRYAAAVPMATELAASLTGGTASATSFTTAASPCPPTTAPAVGTGGGPARQAAVQYALAQRGEPYRWGGVGPSSWDCSGLVLMAYRSAGVTLPRTAGEQREASQGIPAAQAQVGDLVFGAVSATDAGHVRIVVSVRPGVLSTVHAPQTGDVVKLSDVPLSGAVVGRVRV